MTWNKYYYEIESKHLQVCLRRRYGGIRRNAEYELCGLICMQLRRIFKEVNDDKITYVAERVTNTERKVAQYNIAGWSSWQLVGLITRRS